MLVLVLAVLTPVLLAVVGFGYFVLREFIEGWYAMKEIIRLEQLGRTVRRS